MDKANEYKILTRCDGGKLSKVVEYKTGVRVEIPINCDGTVKWFDDSKLIKKSAVIEGKMRV